MNAKLPKALVKHPISELRDFPVEPEIDETQDMLGMLTQRTVDNVLSGTKLLPTRDLDEVRVKRWVTAGRIFTIERGGELLIPTYALDKLGQPEPILGEVLKVLAGRTPFSIAAWFESPNSYLDGKRPREFLATDGLAVVKAAEHSVEGGFHG